MKRADLVEETLVNIGATTNAHRYRSSGLTMHATHDSLNDSGAFAAMPSAARVWVFGAAEPMPDAATDVLLRTVDAYLSQWKAHGTPLVCARAWYDHRFLVVAVDEAATGASGCSIDGLFRVLSTIEATVGTSMVNAGQVYWRDARGAIVAGSRADFKQASNDGTITDNTVVFDLTVTTIGAWQAHFERPLAESWHAQLVRR